VIGDDELFYFTVTICKVLHVGKSFFAVGFQKASTKEVLDLTSFRIECVVRDMEKDNCVMFGISVHGWRRGVEVSSNLLVDRAKQGKEL
jgi:hypothetical protein